jgi:hypothetical protein
VTPRCSGGPKEALGPSAGVSHARGNVTGQKCGPSGPGEVSRRDPSHLSLVRVGPDERPCVRVNYGVMYITMDRRAWNGMGGCRVQ